MVFFVSHSCHFFLWQDPEKEEEEGFAFQLSPHADRRCRRLGVHHRSYSARLVQRRGGAPLDTSRPHPVLPQQLEQALQRAIQEQVVQDPEVRPDDFLYIHVGSNRLRSSYNSARVTVREWESNGDRAREVLQQIERMLNSNEEFDIDDSFTLNVTHVRHPGRGGGRPRARVGTAPIEKMLQSKKSVVCIKNDDNLCAARALVTIKHYRDKGRDQDYQKRVLYPRSSSQRPPSCCRSP